MNKIIIDGLKVNEKKDIYIPFREKYEELYGNNLDALDEVLNYIDESLEVSLVNKNKLREKLGDFYYNSFIEVLDDNNIKHN